MVSQIYEAKRRERQGRSLTAKRLSGLSAFDESRLMTGQ